jgi:selenide,water dikinase
MTTLNRRAADFIREHEVQVNAMTDVTGFGLIGHAREMALASGVSLGISANRIRILPGALECVRSGYVPGGLKNNRDFAECMVQYDKGVPDDIKSLLYDPQTAGGLLMSVTAHGNPWASIMNEAGIPAAEIGEVVAGAKLQIVVTR